MENCLFMYKTIKKSSSPVNLCTDNQILAQWTDQIYVETIEVRRND